MRVIYLKYLIYITIILNCHFAYAQDEVSKQIVAESVVERSNSVNECSAINSEEELPIIKSALRLLGTPYKWGATGPNAFDCSGFTRHVFRVNGYELPRVSRDQSQIGQKVSDCDSLQSGDLIFFGGRVDRYQVHHVGIVKSKDKESGEIFFIHASCRAGVTITKLSQRYYKARYISGRRILKN